MVAASDDEDDAAVVSSQQPAPAVAKQQTLGALFARSNAIPSTASFPSADEDEPPVAARGAPPTEPSVDAAAASALEAFERTEFVPRVDPSDRATLPEDVQRAHAASVGAVGLKDNAAAAGNATAGNAADDDSDNDFGSQIATPLPAADVRAHVDATEARASVVEAAPAPHGGAGGAAREAEVMQDFVDPIVETKLGVVMRGAKKSKKATTGIKFSEHCRNNNLVYAHAMLTVPEGCTDEDKLHFKEAVDGKKCLAPFKIDNAAMFLDLGVDAEKDALNELIDSSDELALWLATSLLVVCNVDSSGDAEKRTFCAFARVELTETPAPCPPATLEHWKTFRRHLGEEPDEPTLVVALHSGVVQKLVRHAVAKRYICQSLMKCFAGTSSSRKKASVVHEYKRLDDNIGGCTEKAKPLFTTAPETHGQATGGGGKRAANSSAAGAAKRAKAGAHSKKIADLLPAAATSAHAAAAAAAAVEANATPVQEEEEAAAAAATTAATTTATTTAAAPAPSSAIVVHADEAPASIWSELAPAAAVTALPYPNAPEIVWFPYDPTKVSLVPCGSTGFLLQFRK